MMSKKIINTALCSFGMSGTVFHAPFINLNDGFNLYAVLERNSNKAELKYPNIKTFSSLEELLKDDNIDLVIVNTPNITHYEIAKKVIHSAKHIIIEKPFTATSQQAKELIVLAKNKNVKLSVFQNRRFDSDFRTVKKVLSENILGEIVDAEIHYDRYVPELSYKVHKETAAVGVGCIYDLGSHIIDQGIQLFGMPNAVFAELRINRKDSKVDDYFDVKLYYSKHSVTLKASYFVKEPLPSYILHGKKGSFLKSRADVQETDLQSGKKIDFENWGIESEKEMGLLNVIVEGKNINKKIPTLNGNYGEYYDQMYHAITNNKTVPVSGEDALQVIQIIEAAIKSNIEKRVIEL